MPKKILIVEDDKRINELLCDYLEMEDYIPVATYNGQEGLEKFESDNFDMVILDIMMPKLDGWSLCRRIRKKSNVLIIIITARSDEEDKLMGFELGADDYIPKPFSPKVFVAKINALFKRLKTHKNFDNKNPIEIDLKSLTVYIEEEPIKLTIKEFKIIETLSSEPDRVFTRENLLQKIWDYNYVGDGRIIDTNIKTLRKKMGKYSNCIVTVIGAGYKYVHPDKKE